jgi:hypothetical protein
MPFNQWCLDQFTLISRDSLSILVGTDKVPQLVEVTFIHLSLPVVIADTF